MAINEADEALLEADEADEADEAWPPPGLRPLQRPSVATGRNLYRQRPSGQYVTQAQLEAAMARVGAQIRANSNAVRTLTGRVESTLVAIRKETAERKKDTQALKKDLQQTKELSALLPLLIQPRSVGPTRSLSGSGIPDGSKPLVQSDDALSTLLPFLLLMGDMGGGGGGGLFGGGEGGSSLMMLVLVLALSKR